MSLIKESEEIILTTEDIHDLLGQLFIKKEINGKKIKITLKDERV